ncbi:AIR synthase-related protein [Lachnospiraceae bacterium LCP25S3_G4]
MKIGNVSQTVLKRSILQQLHTNRSESIISPAVEEMCAGIELQDNQQVIFTSTSVFGNEKDLGIFGIAKIVNDLATRGAEPIGIVIQIHLPPYAYESRLKTMVGYMEQVCETHGLQIFTARAEVNPVIEQSIVYLTGVGAVEKGHLMQSHMTKPGDDIVLLKWIAVEGMLRIARAKEAELNNRFVPSFMQQVLKLEEELFSLNEIRYAREFSVSAMHQIGSGGILAALWEVAEAADVGLEVEIKKMSLKQETIEVCEFYRVNPYQLTSTGSILVMCKQGEQIVDAMQARGMHAKMIGRTTSGKERVILGGEEKRYIDRPQQDELVKIYHTKCN